MVRHIAFLILLITSSLFAAIRGGPPERIAAASLLAAALASVAVATTFKDRFHHVETGILSVDISLLSILLWLAHRSTRFWPIWIAGFLAAEVFVHLVRPVLPESFTQEYMDAIALWAWFAQIILIIATIRHRRRLRTFGVDIPWKN